MSSILDAKSWTSIYGERHLISSCNPRHAKTREPTFRGKRLQLTTGYRHLEGKTAPTKFGDPRRVPWHGISQRADAHIARLTSLGGEFIGADGNTVELKGVNHFGFNVSDGKGILTSMWGPDDDNQKSSLTMDFPTIVLRMKLLGFNTVRLPFSFKVLKSSTFESWAYGTKPVSKEDILRSVVPDEQLARYKTPGGDDYFMSVIVPQHPPPKLFDVDPPGTSSTQNSNLPNNTLLHRFIYVVKYLILNGFYVIIENHLSEQEKGDSDNTIVANDKTVWGQEWKDLVYNINVNPRYGGASGHNGIKYEDFLIVDLLNEPDALVTWTNRLRRDARGNSIENLKPNWDDLSQYYFCAIDMVREVSPKTMFFVGGCGSAHEETHQNWGDDFEDGGGSRNFFNTLLSKDYVTQVALSPHVYPPSVADKDHQNTDLQSKFQPQACWDRWLNSFGKKVSQRAANGHIFPVCIGEIGTKRLANDPSTEYHNSDVRDESVMESFKTFLRDEVPQTTRGRKIRSLLWWAWANAPDSGSLTAAHGDAGEFSKIQFNKIKWMVEAVGLKPWYTTLP